MIGVRPEGLTKNLCKICSFLISLCNLTTREVFSCDSTRKWRKTSGFGLWNPRNPTILKAQPKSRTHSHRERRNTKWRRTKAISSSIRSHCWTKWLQTPITSSTSSLSSLTSPFAAPPPMSSRLPSPPIFFTEYSIPLSINLYHFPIFFIVDLVYLRECHILMFQSHMITLPLCVTVLKNFNVLMFLLRKFKQLLHSLCWLSSRYVHHFTSLPFLWILWMIDYSHGLLFGLIHLDIMWMHIEVVVMLSCFQPELEY